MDLKKNDKIILIVGVVILIVAGAGIALYTAPTAEDTDLDDTKDIGYEFEWVKKTGSTTVESPMVGKKTSLEKSYTIAGPPAGCVLTKVDVKINWEDDRTYGLLTTRGGDTLTAEVTLDGKNMEDTSELSGNHSFPFNVYSKPDSAKVNASNPGDASTKLKQEYAGKNSADFDVILTIDVGEPLWRPWKRFRDKGNTVDISVDYTYYTHELIEVDEDNDDTKSTGNDDVVVSSHAVGEFYVNLGYGRGMI